MNSTSSSFQPEGFPFILIFSCGVVSMLNYSNKDNYFAFVAFPPFLLPPFRCIHVLDTIIFYVAFLILFLTGSSSILARVSSFAYAVATGRV